MKKNSTSVKKMVQMLFIVISMMSIMLSSANAADPGILSVSPANGGSGISITTQVVVIFSVNMNASTINSSTFELRGKGNNAVSAIISYDATLRKAILTPVSPLAYETSYKATVKGGKNGVKDAAGNNMKGDYEWSFTTVPAPDVTPPFIKSVEPGNGAGGINLNSEVSAKFSEDMNPGTITTATFELRNGANQIVPATVSYHDAPKKATLTLSSPLSNSVVYTARIKGGSSGVKDLAGNALVADYSWSFTTPFTIFQPTDAPVTPVITDQPGEVGVKFTTTQNGNIFGIRFYKGTGNDGTHIGHLWNSAGTLLAEATFTNETTLGWQQVLFSSPVAVSAGQIYTASYFSSSGKYGFTNSYFITSVVNGPVRALANGESGGNGVYTYSPLPAFPASSFNATNYFVDVLFASDTNSDDDRIYVENNRSVPAVTGLAVAKEIAKDKEQLLADNMRKRPGIITVAFDVKTMPNPSADNFNMIINSNDANPVTIRVTDISGRLIETHEKVTSTGVLRLGQTWNCGIYFAEVVQGDQRKVIKMIKIN